MSGTPTQSLTTLLDAVRAGRPGAFDRVFAQVYDELRRLAHAVRDGRGTTLHTTALVHEAYLKLAGAEVLAADNRLHFMRIAARAMRQVLINAAERRLAAKRGGGQVDVTFEEQVQPRAVDADGLLALDAALTRLAKLDPRQARVVECRYFAGLTIPETADALGVSVPTINREWRMARAWLASELTSTPESDSPAS